MISRPQSASADSAVLLVKQNYVATVVFILFLQKKQTTIKIFINNVNKVHPTYICIFSSKAKAFVLDLEF